jgi:RimJ/RimL family protein N-acetyltransferase
MLIPLDTVGPEIEIGWRFRPEFWGKGFATEASSTLLRHGLGALKLNQVMAEIDSENVASIRVAEKIGMVECPCVRPNYRRFVAAK